MSRKVRNLCCGDIVMMKRIQEEWDGHSRTMVKVGPILLKVMDTGSANYYGAQVYHCLVVSQGPAHGRSRYVTAKDVSVVAPADGRKV